MIVNSNIEQIHMDPPSQQQQEHPSPSSISTTISTSSCTGISENFYLKRKHDELTDPLDNCNYIQPKKRLIQYQQHQQSQQQFTIIDENYQNLANSQSQQHQQQQHDTQHCDLQFNLNNNNNNNTNFINCHTIEFLNYDNLNSIPTATTTTVYTTSSPITTTNTEHFDTNQCWQTTTDLLELDQRYNPISHRFIDNKIEHNSNDIQRNDDNIVYQQHNHQQQQLQQQLQQISQQQQNHQNNKNQEIHHQILQQDHQHQQHQHHQHQQNLIPLNIVHEQLNLNSQQQQSLRDKSMPKSSDQETDFEDKNLSWLFNFRLDELPHLSPDIQNNHKNSASVPLILNNSHNINQQQQQQQQHHNKSINENKITQQSKTGKKVDELIKELTAEITEDGDMIVGENVIVENSLSPPRGPKKPPFTYTELIEYALEERGELTVSGIYQWISDRFPYYKSNDDRWKNSVRHNLSINPHFRKGLKAPQGAGHLWTISSRDSEENALAWEHKKQRLELFFKMEQLHNQRQQNSNQQQEQNENNNQQNYSVMDETSIAVQQITQQMQSDCTSNCRTDLNINHSPLNNRTIVTTTTTPTIAGLPLGNIIHNGNDLKKSAGEILNGIRRTVEVQPINCRTIGTYHDSLLETEDYLNPMHKDEDIITHEEGGFRNEFYVTEIDPIELGINITNVEEEVLFSEEFNLNYFGITSSNDIVA